MLSQGSRQLTVGRAGIAGKASRTRARLPSSRPTVLFKAQKTRLINRNIYGNYVVRWGDGFISHLVVNIWPTGSWNSCTMFRFSSLNFIKILWHFNEPAKYQIARYVWKWVIYLKKRSIFLLHNADVCTVYISVFNLNTQYFSWADDVPDVSVWSLVALGSGFVPLGVRIAVKAWSDKALGEAAA